ncbi:hypothetical protein L2725_12810 [Shewanella corallii]|uniref:Uncharacterized protein n=1 Tax=Shewanella corallii TaxID=560080 RepID=A0ABT0N864_9GAMM|nr:hypothetical protein [Shewanella corallii]MCL2914649.1 hypothetical protein [Shewanella corallii]
MDIKVFFVRLFVLSTCLLSTSLFAAPPTCHSSHDGYCQYSGTVKSIYVNSGNVILMYFDTGFDPSSASGAGFTVSNGNAAAIRITDNPAFANLFYSTALAAQASGRPVTVQMRGVISGYLKIDRIWLAEE